LAIRSTRTAEPALVPIVLSVLALAGCASQRAGKWNERGEQIQPDVPRFHVNLGLSLMGLRQPGRAEESFRRALALDPGHSEARRGLAAAQAASRARGDAEAPFAAVRH
jgi:Flp pilus assembly protein TadD